MKSFILPLFGFHWILSVIPNEALAWERLAEKWGIAFVGIALLMTLAGWVDRREKVVQKERSQREHASNEERLALLRINNELQLQQIAATQDHALRIERLTKEGTTAIKDSGAAMRMLVRKMQRPCVAPFTRPED